MCIEGEIMKPEKADYMRISELIRVKLQTAKVKFILSSESFLVMLYWLLTQKMY